MSKTATFKVNRSHDELFDNRLVPYSWFPMAYLGYLSNIGMP